MPEIAGSSNVAKNPKKQSGSARIGWLVVITVSVVVAAIALATVRRQAAAKTSAKSGPGGRSNAPVSVIIGTVEKKDVPIYLDGLGTAQAFNTVTVRSRVDGQLLKLAFTEGQDVKMGELLAQIDPAPFQNQVDQAKAKKAQDEAQLQNARIDLKRNEELLKSKIVAQEVYDTAQALVRQLEAAVQADEAATKTAQVQLGYTTIVAPIEGRSGLRLVDVGNIIRSGDSNGIVVLAQLKPISVIFTLPEQSLPTIHAEMAQHEMEVVALDRDNRTELDHGKLSVVDNQIDPTTGTIRLKATFPNEGMKLWPGQFVNSRLLLTVRKDGVVVPASVVQRGPEGPYAFVVKNDMTAEMRKLTVVQTERGQTLIENGLEPGERVVVDGQYKLQPGAQVRPAEAAPQGPRKMAGTNAPPQTVKGAGTNSPGQRAKSSSKSPS